MSAMVVKSVVSSYVAKPAGTRAVPAASVSEVIAGVEEPAAMHMLEPFASWEC